jgi:hypothetical protein
LGGWQKKETASHPVLGSKAQNLDCFIICIDVADACRTIDNSVDQRGVETPQVVGIKIVECAGGKMHQIVSPDGRSDELNRVVEAREFPSTVIAADQDSRAALIDEAAWQRVVYDQDRPVDSWHLSLEDLVDLLLRARVLLRPETGKDRQDAHFCRCLKVVISRTVPITTTFRNTRLTDASSCSTKSTPMPLLLVREMRHKDSRFGAGQDTMRSLLTDRELKFSSRRRLLRWLGLPGRLKNSDDSEARRATFAAFACLSMDAALMGRHALHAA